MLPALSPCAAARAAASLRLGADTPRQPSPVASPPWASATSSSPLALAAVATAAVVGSRRGRSSAAAGRSVVEVVDVEDQSTGSADLVKAILKRCTTEGVPLCNRPMEYLASPRKSPLEKCGISILEGTQDPTRALVMGLRASGIDEDRAEVGAATLCLMLGGLDEAHNLVTPHSWAAPTTFGGQPKPGSSMRTEASYCHVIVHRNEGTHIGEFGTGFNNSGYWTSNAFAGGAHAIFPALRAAAEDLAKDCPEAKPLLRSMGPEWEPRAFNRFCQEAVEFEESEQLEFCKAVQAAELRLLFQHVTGLDLQP